LAGNLNILKMSVNLLLVSVLDYDEYLATPNNFPTLIKMRAFESFSWDKLDGGHVSFIKT
jgi:hypothetical protein